MRLSLDAQCGPAERRGSGIGMCKPIYVIAGKEESLVNAECSQLLEKLLKPHERVTGLFVADAGQTQISEVLDELRTVPFLTDKRVALIKRADEFISNNRPWLEKYFDDPCPTGVLVLTVSSWPSQTKLAKKLTKVGTLVKVTAPKPWQLPARLSKYAGDAHGKKLAPNAAELLIELTGDDVSRLYGEIDKLALFVDTEKVITAKHVESLIGHNRIFGAFAVIDTIMAGDAARAIGRLRNMFAEDKTAEFTVVGAFAYHLRRMFGAKALLARGIDPGQVAGQCRIWSNKDKFFAQLRQMSLERIGANLRRLASIDHAIKTGQTKAQVAMEQFVLRLATG
ncbi:MAG: DNA polymerase III subunit delta [Phycisphaerales bacterium]|nr:MAG: DNA polymerase III subunit delta [Phycisphaerales bacterium]